MNNTFHEGYKDTPITEKKYLCPELCGQKISPLDNIIHNGRCPGCGTPIFGESEYQDGNLIFFGIDEEDLIDDLHTCFGYERVKEND